MRPTLPILLLLALFLAVLGAAPAAAEKNNAANPNALLKGIGGPTPPTPKPSVSLLLRDDLKDAFRAVMGAYLEEDEEAYLSRFGEKVSMASLERRKKPAVVGREDLRARVRKEWGAADYTQLKVDDVFDFTTPTMIFVLSEEQMHDKIPVWAFAQEPSDIARFMKPGDYLVIANTKPQAADKVSTLPFSYYLIFRKQDDKYVAVGLD